MMRSIRTAATSMVLAAGLSAGAAGLAGAASAAPAPPAPSPVKSYPTWPAAQRAAGFQLVRPTATAGLRRRGGIMVAACRPLRRPAGPRQVTVRYGGPLRRPAFRMITFTQAGRARGRCIGPLGPGPGKIIARVRIDGAPAILARSRVHLCVERPGGKAKCTRAVILQLSWTRHGHPYRVMGVGEHRAQILGFARSLVAAG
jgi:hypothetical protein